MLSFAVMPRGASWVLGRNVVASEATFPAPGAAHYPNISAYFNRPPVPAFSPYLRGEPVLPWRQQMRGRTLPFPDKSRPMIARLILASGDTLPGLHLAELPRAGDTLGLPDGRLVRIERVHWPLDAAGRCEAAELHAIPAALTPEATGRAARPQEAPGAARAPIRLP
jgi:hypothetical protein